MKHTASASRKASSARSKRRRHKYVMCIDDDGYSASFEVGKVYRAMTGDADIPNWIQVIDESGEDYLYPAKRFVPVDLPPRARRAVTAQALARG